MKYDAADLEKGLMHSTLKSKGVDIVSHSCPNIGDSYGTLKLKLWHKQVSEFCDRSDVYFCLVFFARHF